MDFFQSSGSYNRSEYYNFTGPPIDCDGHGISVFRVFINDDDPNYNWSRTAAENEWCNGSGTEEDPYIIEKLYINAHKVGGCVYIKNSKKHFTIKNCWFENSEWDEYGNGVFMHYVENGTVKDSLVLYTHTAIRTLGDIYNVTISNNIIISDHTGKVGGRGIKSSDSHNIIFLDNKILNHYQGMMIYGSSEIIVEGNIIENTIWEEFDGPTIHVINTNYSQFIRNIFSGALAQRTFKVDQVSCEENVIESNYVSADQNLRFDFNLSLSSNNNKPKRQGSSYGIIVLEWSNYNYVRYNVSVIELPPREITIFDLFLILGYISIVTAIVVVILMVKREKRV